MDKNSHKAFLHSQVKDFQALAGDARFVSAMSYMRKHIAPQGITQIPADSLIRNEGRFQGWFECLDELESLLEPPKAEQENTRTRAAYQPPTK